jgi:hypothetical protein
VLQGAVGAVLVEMCRVLGQDVFEMAPVEDQYRSSSSRRRVPIHRSAIAFARGARTGVRRMRMPSLVNTASKTSVNLASRSRIKNWKSRHALAEVHQQIPCLLSNPGSARVRGDSQKVHTAGGVLHEEQDRQPLAQQRIDAEEVGRANALCLCGQELSPGGVYRAKIRCMAH